ncbi:MAG: M50 family metallopeptidase [Terriglobales bacterium]
MPSARQGSIRLFRFSGIDVFLHWSWFVVAAYEIQSRSGRYSSVTWNVLEYLALFLIVTLHEFGHSLACRQVGGQANQIVLWPLGGVAYVDPPPRPGATLWSIAAGPLVNVALLPFLYGVFLQSKSLGWAHTMPDLYKLVVAVLTIDIGLLLFNILPIYPLDGGQILRSLLWFVFGRARSLTVAAIVGLVGVTAFIGLAFWSRDVWLGAIAVFMLMNCWGGLRHAQALAHFAKLPRRENFACPRCKSNPPIGAFWKCGRCGQPFDTFQTQAACPNCATQFAITKCLDCGAVSPMSEWVSPVISASSTFGNEVRG